MPPLQPRRGIRKRRGDLWVEVKMDLSKQQNYINASIKNIKLYSAQWRSSSREEQESHPREQNGKQAPPGMGRIRTRRKILGKIPSVVQSRVFTGRVAPVGSSGRLPRLLHLPAQAPGWLAAAAGLHPMAGLGFCPGETRTLRQSVLHRRRLERPQS